jgi:hypothetical protein
MVPFLLREAVGYLVDTKAFVKQLQDIQSSALFFGIHLLLCVVICLRVCRMVVLVDDTVVHGALCTCSHSTEQ